MSDFAQEIIAAIVMLVIGGYLLSDAALSGTRSRFMNRCLEQSPAMDCARAWEKAAR